MKLEFDDEMIDIIFESALNACDMEKYDKGLRLLVKISDMGHKEAKYQIGNMYLQGKGVDQDFEKAKKYFLELANENNTYAINNIGAILCKQDKYVEAIKWFEKALNNGSKQAASNLGVIYEEGLSGEINKKKALIYYYEAALLGDVESQKKVNELQDEICATLTDISTKVGIE